MSKETPPIRNESPLYFFPEREVTASDLKEILDDGSPEERARAIANLLRYAQWEDIWIYITRDEVREVLPSLNLPESLARAWSRMLNREAPVGS